MAGGSGTRFWPLSRENKPKQFLTLFNNKSMIRLTYERCLQITTQEDIYIVTTERQIDLIKEHIPEIKDKQIIVEPCSRNTAPCIALSTLYLSQFYDSSETMVILPADHYIPKSNDFKITILKAYQHTNDKNIITFGITPTYPATGYGYIETGDAVSEGLFHVKHFKEKPDLETAKSYLNRGASIYWNSGIFCSTLASMLNNLEINCPNLLSSAKKALACSDKASRFSVYKEIECCPIDTAVIEMSKEILVSPASFIWSDVGNWNSLSELTTNTDGSNYFNNDHVSVDSYNNYVISDKFVTLLGVDNLIIIDTAETLLVVSKDHVERVKDITDIVRQDKPALL